MEVYWSSLTSKVNTKHVYALLRLSYRNNIELIVMIFYKIYFFHDKQKVSLLEWWHFWGLEGLKLWAVDTINYKKIM